MSLSLDQKITEICDKVRTSYREYVVRTKACGVDFLYNNAAEVYTVQQIVNFFDELGNGGVTLLECEISWLWLGCQQPGFFEELCRTALTDEFFNVDDLYTAKNSIVMYFSAQNTKQ